MTREEVQKILAIIGATYPNFKPEDKTATVEAWHLLLEEYAYRDIAIAFKTYVNTSGRGFAPSVDQLICMTHKASELSYLTEGEAWALVEKAIRNSAYNSAEEFEKLGRYPAIQKAIGSPSQLYAWAVDSEYNGSVISSNFMRCYRNALEQEKQISYLPSEARDRLGELQSRALGIGVKDELST